MKKSETRKAFLEVSSMFCHKLKWKVSAVERYSEWLGGAMPCIRGFISARGKHAAYMKPTYLLS